MEKEATVISNSISSASAFFKLNVFAPDEVFSEGRLRDMLLRKPGISNCRGTANHSVEVPCRPMTAFRPNLP